MIYSAAHCSSDEDEVDEAIRICMMAIQQEYPDHDVNVNVRVKVADGDGYVVAFPVDDKDGEPIGKVLEFDI